MQLHDPAGRRLYLTAEERPGFLAAAARSARPVRTLRGVLHTTGCLISHVLALTPERVDLSGKAIVFESLKKPRRGKGPADRSLWPVSRMTVWRQVITVMEAADIPAGPHRTPEGLRPSRVLPDRRNSAPGGRCPAGAQW